FPGERPVDHISQKSAHAVCVGKSLAREQAVKLAPDVVRGGLHAISMAQIQSPAGCPNCQEGRLLTVTLTATHWQTGASSATLREGRRMTCQEVLTMFITRRSIVRVAFTFGVGLALAAT